MKYVLDSCVAFKWAVREVDTDKALQLRDDYRKAVHELISPDVLPAEIGHALTRAERQGRIAPPNGWAAWLAIMADAPHLFSYISLMPRAYAISSQARIGIYDCLYLALAEQENCQFVTSDDKLVKKLLSQFPFIIPLASLP
ncbi:MAG TPA: type II toxin-antitoxin system VapC family toxin [Gemmataceae bacterium]|jgi:predicted nucleic acid-binding protein|nr:type II toxin-antitoxin system VapC family toxin [Gemmataceae bacterium]